jgi:hypothetical protein
MSNYDAFEKSKGTDRSGHGRAFSIFFLLPMAHFLLDGMTLVLTPTNHWVDLLHGFRMVFFSQGLASAKRGKTRPHVDGLNKQND